MVEKPYNWTEGALLQKHTEIKHKILSEYIYEYCLVRWRHPYQQIAKLSIVDGFSGAGRYANGEPGSPIIFIEQILRAHSTINIKRKKENLPPLKLHCLFIFNDVNKDAIAKLKENINLLPFQQKQDPLFNFSIEYFNDTFLSIIPSILDLMTKMRSQNIIINLDQCGYSHVNRDFIKIFMKNFQHAEIFLTFMIKPLLTFLKETDSKSIENQLGFLGEIENFDTFIERHSSKPEWLLGIEKLVFDSFSDCAEFRSPFSIHSESGWRYWLIHFSRHFMARQVFNNILHKHSTTQAHYGKIGLDMLAYDPKDDKNQLYLFDKFGREASRQALIEDIPRVISAYGDAMPLTELYREIYNTTSSHSEDISASLIASPDLNVRNKSGGLRKKSKSIQSADIVEISNQRSFFPMFVEKKK